MIWSKSVPTKTTNGCLVCFTSWSLASRLLIVSFNLETSYGKSKKRNKKQNKNQKENYVNKNEHTSMCVMKPFWTSCLLGLQPFTSSATPLVFFLEIVCTGTMKHKLINTAIGLKFPKIKKKTSCNLQLTIVYLDNSKHKTHLLLWSTVLVLWELH